MSEVVRSASKSRSKDRSGIPERFGGGRTVPYPYVLTLDWILDNCLSEDRLDHDACMNWMHGCNNRGAPIFRHIGKMANLRRLVWSMHRDGEEIPEGLLAYQTCESKRCLNPSHIIVSSRSKIQNEYSKRGAYSSPARAAKIAATLRSKSKLTAEIAAEIRSVSYKANAVELADRYGVCEATIYNIWSGRTWSDVSLVSKASSVFAWRP